MYHGVIPLSGDEEQRRLEWLREHQPEIAELLTRQKRWDWLAVMLRNVAIWLAAMMAGWLALRQGIAEFMGDKNG